MPLPFPLPPLLPRSPVRPLPLTPYAGRSAARLQRGKFDDNRKLPDGRMLEFAKVYPLDAVFDSPEDVPEDVRANKVCCGRLSMRAY